MLRITILFLFAIFAQGMTLPEEQTPGLTHGSLRGLTFRQPSDSNFSGGLSYSLFNSEDSVNLRKRELILNKKIGDLNAVIGKLDKEMDNKRLFFSKAEKSGKISSQEWNLNIRKFLRLEILSADAKRQKNNELIKVWVHKIEVYKCNNLTATLGLIKEIYGILADLESLETFKKQREDRLIETEMRDFGNKEIGNGGRDEKEMC